MRSALRLRLLTAIWILSWRSSRLCKGKCMVLEIRMDKESSHGIGMRLLAPRQNNLNLIFFGSPYQPRPRLLWKIYPGKSTAVRRSCFLPHCTDIDYKLLHIHTYIKICTHLPSRSLFFSSPSSCYAVFFSPPVYLHFTTDYTLSDCV